MVEILVLVVQKENITSSLPLPLCFAYPLDKADHPLTVFLHHSIPLFQPPTHTGTPTEPVDHSSLILLHLLPFQFPSLCSRPPDMASPSSLSLYSWVYTDPGGKPRFPTSYKPSQTFPTFIPSPFFNVNCQYLRGKRPL